MPDELFSSALASERLVELPLSDRTGCRLLKAADELTGTSCRPAEPPAIRQSAIGYLRVSTKEQGRSGLRLGAQRQAIESFGVQEGFSIKSWHQDVQTGAGADALLLRPGLAAALKEAGSALPTSRLQT